MAVCTRGPQVDHSTRRGLDFSSRSLGFTVGLTIFECRREEPLVPGGSTT